MYDKLANAKILVVDDFQGMRTMLRDFVKSMGVSNVDTAGTSKDALQQLKSSKYDIVICDYNLGPGQPNGQQILDMARLHEYVGLSTIWVMVTAEKTTDMVMGAVEVKPDDYLLKPINQSLLQARLEKLIARKKSLVNIETAIRRKDYRGAIAQCDKQLQAEDVVNPQEITRIKSDLLLTVGEYAAAKELFNTVLETRSVPWATTGLGKIAFHAGNLSGARDIFQEVLRENPMYMEASDWLVKTFERLGESANAQQVLAEAVKISPNSSQRQKTLGDIAYRNGELDVAQAAYEKNIKVSEFSAHKSSAVYAGLAKVHTGKNAPDEALKVLNQSKAAFKDSPQAALQTAAVESMVYQKMGDTTKAKAALETAEKMLRTMGQVNAEMTLDMAQACFALGEKDKGLGLMRDLVQNNHDNPDISRQVAAVFTEANMADEGMAFVKASQQEVININNQGVTLAKSGEFFEAVKLLRDAVQRLPNNETVIANLCGLLIGLMNKEGADPDLVFEGQGLLDRLQTLNPANRKLATYAADFKRLSGSV